MTSDNKSPGRLERLLRAGSFVVTAETTPPLTSDAYQVVDRVAPLKGLADAVNVTDGAGARAHLSSLVAAAKMLEAGIEPVLQFTTRDRNTLALERDVLGAAAFHIPNMLVIGGDPIERGDAPDASAINDLDSKGLVGLVALMRDQAKLPSGREIVPAPKLLVGVADTPVDPPAGWQPHGLQAKIAAGADFVQTQFCFDIDICRRYVAALVDLGITRQVFVLIGIGPLASARQAVWIRDNLPGSIIPDTVIARLENADDPKAEGRAVCAELMQELTSLSGVAGAHLMGPRAETEIARTIDASGILNDRQSA